MKTGKILLFIALIFFIGYNTYLDFDRADILIEELICRFVFTILFIIGLLLPGSCEDQDKKPVFLVKAKFPNSKYLSHAKEYKIEWTSKEGYYAVRNDVGRIRTYAPVNFSSVYKPGKRP